MRPIFLPVLLSALMVGGAAASEPSAPLVSAGEQVARRNCAECHALAPGQASPLADAPTFPDLRSRFSRARMATVIERRMIVIHPRMPKLELDEDEVDAFLDYWDGIQPSRPPRARKSSWPVALLPTPSQAAAKR